MHNQCCLKAWMFHFLVARGHHGASIMYWSLQQQIERSESSPSLSPSTAASINGEDKSSLIGEVSKLTMDDTAFDTAVSSQVENEITSGASIYRVLSLVQS